MTEIFKPRVNMIYNPWIHIHECRDQNNKYICDGGPSKIWEDGYWEFYISGVGYHRLDGPAFSDNFKNVSETWWIKENITREIKKFAKENDINLKNLSDEDKVMIALKFG